MYDGAYVKKYISVTRNNSAVPSGEYMVKTEKLADGTTKVTVSMENNLEPGGEYKIVISKDLYDRDGIVSGTDALIEFTVGKLTYTFDRTKNEATVTSDMSDEYSVLIIIKAVKDNRLVEVELLNGKVTQDAALAKTMSNVPDGAEVSAMFWDGFGSMRPLTYVQ